MAHAVLLLAVLALTLHSQAAQPTSGMRPVLQQSESRATTPATLDYDVFKSKVQPILMVKRPGNARCISCHARGAGDAYLEPLAPGSTTYTEEQTRRNFERVQRLVVPGEPLKSLLLLNPLAEEAGGSHWHGGGKHWTSQDNPEWQTLAAWVRTRPAAATVAATARPALNYDVFKSKVQPILMVKRPGNARCISCHARGAGDAYLEPLAPGSTTYTEEQTRRNFERVQRLVVPGEPLKSLLLLNPLAEEAGGSHWHGGGKHWTSQDNPEWQTLAAWVHSN